MIFSKRETLCDSICKLEKKKENLQREYDKLVINQEKLMKEHNLYKYGRRNGKVTLDPEELKKISNSVIPVGCFLLRQLSRFDLIEIILVREKLLYNKIHEFNESLKHNDREVFKTLKAENEDLREYLTCNDKAYKQLKMCEAANNELKNYIKKWKNCKHVKGLQNFM